MSENKEDFSAYLAWQSNYSTMWALFSGFTFTAITMVLFQYPDLSQISAQTTLFVLTVMLDQFLLQLHSRDFQLRSCVRVAPKLPDIPLYLSKTVSFIFTGLSWILLGGSVVLMFFIWNLVYLALASTIVGVFYVVAAYYLYVKAYGQFIRPFSRV